MIFIATITNLHYSNTQYFGLEDECYRGIIWPLSSLVLTREKTIYANCFMSYILQEKNKRASDTKIKAAAGIICSL